jgi:hypothetical protein
MDQNLLIYHGLDQVHVVGVKVNSKISEIIHDMI